LPDSETDLIIVGIGASAGGLESLKEFFDAMPSRSGMAFVVIQHLDPDHTSYMADILGQHTQMQVRQATDGMTIAADHVYTIPPNKFLRIEKGRVYLAEPQKSDGVRMPIDFFFRSLAEDQRERAVCVIFSGSGSDGTQGLREVRAAGGLTIVQEPETAQFDAMLRSAIATGMVDCVLPLTKIPETLQRYKPRVGASDKSDDRDKLELLDAMLDVLASHNSNDFSAYKKTTLLRRVERRMGINHLDSLADYLRFLQANPAEADELGRDMLIGVSSFFRDPEAFEELRRSVIAPLVRQRNNHSPVLRVWIPGCSTGEEAYSIAILLLEELDAAEKNCPLQVFATDVDSESLKFAREGTYPRSIAADVDESRLARFFTKRDSTYQVSKRVREAVIFSLQNLLTEPPFSRLDLISCRNLLIYIEPPVQRKLLSLFAFALNPEGHLFLGKSDGMASHSALFASVSSKWRIYRRTSAHPVTPAFSYGRGGRIWGLDPPATKPQPNLSELNEQILLQHFNAAAVLVNEHGTILHFFGATGKYLEHPTGEANLNLLNMLESKLSAKLRVALRKLGKDAEPVRFESVELDRRGANLRANITIRTIASAPKTEHVYAVIFEEAAAQPNALTSKHTAAGPGEDESLVAQLETELKSLKTEFQATIDEYETSAEELKAANEEILSINEELQSTNEELETSKEEIQAVNEELNTVNQQLNSKVEELTEVNNDLVNFLNSSDVATIFLDSQLRIKRFTPSATAIMNLIPTDVGRPIEHMAQRFAGVDLTLDAKNVLQSLAVSKREVRSSDNRWFLLTCLPYRTIDNKIDGVVFTFNDVTALKQSEISMGEARNFAQGIVDTVRESLLVLDSDLRVVSANKAFYQNFQLTPADNRSVFDLGNGQWNIPRLHDLLENLASKNVAFNDFEIEHEFSVGSRHLLLNARRIERETTPGKLILLAMEDITERKRMVELLANEERLRQHNRALEQQLIASGRLVSLGEITASMAHEFNNPLGVVLGFVEDLLEETDPASPQYAPLRIIEEESRRCEKIIQDLMQFARPGDAQRRQTYVHAVIDTTLHMMESRLYKQKVTSARRIQPDLLPIEADPQQLEQVLINLYLNAIDAMPEGGTLTVGAEQGSDKQTTVITVTDTGRGMTAEEVEKVFQPFYTANKKTGLGLGLPICERIIKNHGGRIEVESEPKKGTTFKIILPLSPPPGPGGHDEPVKIRLLPN
jgi:two-component system, chemotaxis family, CheB/CheR fusion protein